MVTHELIETWRQCPTDNPPYCLSTDAVLLAENLCYPPISFEEYVQSKHFGQANDTKFHLGLVPLPYVGNLETAKIFLLMLNPGFHPGDYFAEYNVTGFREEVIRNLYQENLNKEYPFLFLNPQFAWHPGFSYWYGKFYSVVKAIEKANDITHHQALSLLSQNLACLELIPYHSKSYSLPNPIYKALQSPKLMLRFVRDELQERAINGEIGIIVTRKSNVWGLSENDDIVIFNGQEARAAHLTQKSQILIANHLGL